MQLCQFLTQSPEWLCDKLDAAAYPLRDRRSLLSYETAFDAMLAGGGGWQQFEQRFVPEFFRYMERSGERLSRYLGELRRLRGTILDYYMVPIGGPGKTDMRQVSRYEVMNELCEGGFIADAKQFVRSRLDTDDVRNVFWHLANDPTHPKRAIIVVARDDVPSGVWEAVMQRRQATGFWEIILLTRYLVLELVSQLGVENLLSS